MKAIINGKLVLPNAVILDKALVFNNTIKNIADISDIPADSEIIDANGGYVLPGFVDIHVHGGGGCDFLDGSIDAVNTVTYTHAKHGTTSLLATTLTCENDVLFGGIDCVVSAMKQGTKGAQILGLHLEGPYFSSASRGAQAIKDQRIPTEPEIEEIYNRADGKIVRWDAAPELPNMDLFANWLKEKHILASIGHSAANAECSLNAFKNGFTHITHMYCSTTTEHKEGQVVHGGIIEATYLEDGFTTELIADGKHIPRETMLLVFKIKGADKTVLTTDAMRAAGTDCKTSVLGALNGGTPVIVEDGVAKLTDRSSFAGSIGTMDVALKTAVKYGVPLLDAVKSLSLTPATVIGFAETKGSLENGKDADIVITDINFNVNKVFIGGDLLI